MQIADIDQLLARIKRITELYLIARDPNGKPKMLQHESGESYAPPPVGLGKKRADAIIGFVNVALTEANPAHKELLVMAIFDALVHSSSSDLKFSMFGELHRNGLLTFPHHEFVSTSRHLSSETGEEVREERCIDVIQSVKLGVAHYQKAILAGSVVIVGAHPSALYHVTKIACHEAINPPSAASRFFTAIASALSKKAKRNALSEEAIQEITYASNGQKR